MTLKTPTPQYMRDTTMLPELFRKNGYRTEQSGKIYHTGPEHEDPRSWDYAVLFMHAAVARPGSLLRYRRSRQHLAGGAYLPAWTKATYSSELLAQLAQIEQVTTFKIGTREMSKYDRDIRAIRASSPQCTILTCHDEYLLPTLVHGIDGALVGFGSFLPEWIAGLYDAVCRGDLK